MTCYLEEDSMTHKRLFISIFVLVLISILISGCGSTTTPDPSVVWSDDFEDGDTDGWEQMLGNKEHFVSEGAVNFGSGGGAIIYPNSINYGTWSFDVFIPDKGGSTNEIWFIASEIGDTQYAAFPITIEHQPFTVLEFNHLVGEEETVLDAVTISEGEILSGWHHIDITRDDNQSVKVFFNKELVYEFNEDFPYDSMAFNYWFCCDGPALDNVVVHDQVIDIQP
jgi:hypothetical protein